MKRCQLILIMAASVLLVASAWAAQPRQLSWEELIPAQLRDRNPLAHLPPEQQEMVYWIITALQRTPARNPETESLYAALDEATPLLEAQGIHLDKIMAQIKEVQTSVASDLDGQQVRIPGYLLPLETTGRKVSEFLLVPYFGACIHVPPPPPNQIIHVKMKKGSYSSKGLFDPVWVTGVLSVQATVQDLFLEDGTAGIDIGYAIQASRVERYQE